MLARVIRAITASGMVARATAGSTRCRSASGIIAQFRWRTASTRTKWVHGS